MLRYASRENLTAATVDAPRDLTIRVRFVGPYDQPAHGTEQLHVVRFAETGYFLMAKDGTTSLPTAGTYLTDVVGISSSEARGTGVYACLLRARNIGIPAVSAQPLNDIWELAFHDKKRIMT